MAKKETHITMERNGQRAEVYTSEPALLRKLNRYAKRYPEQCAILNESPDGKLYSVHRDLIRIEIREPRAERRHHWGIEIEGQLRKAGRVNDACIN